MILPDLLDHGLTTLLCGSAVGAASARVGAPYAGPGNKFWPTLAATGLTPRRLAPHEYRLLLGCGIGLTDINKTEAGCDRDLSPGADDPLALLRKVEAYRPRILAFTAKRPARVFLRAVFGRADADYGPQEERIGGTTELFVLPCPSGLACRWWAANEVWWHRLADRHRALRGSAGGPDG
jgi:double-stranded uracil-DNA glycosylase